MISIYHSSSKSDSIAAASSARDGSWIHVVAPDEAELEQAAKTYKLDPDLLTDAIDLYESPRVERSEDGVYVFTRYYHPDNGVINATEPLLIVYQPAAIVTVLRINSAILDPFVSGRQRMITTQKTKTLLQILEAVNDSYRGYVTRATRRIFRARSQLKRTGTDNNVLLDFIGMEDDLNEFLSALEPQAAVLRTLLSGKYMRLYEEDKDLVEDLTLNTNEMIQLVSSLLKTIITIRQSYDAIATSELNRTFRRLTSISIFLMIPTIVSGLYGMNVGLPLDEHPFAFWFVLLLVFGLSGTMVLIFRHKRWL